MAIEHVGTGRITRTTALPDSASGGFAACGWAKITGTRSGFSSLFEMLNTGISGTQINLGVLSTDTALQLYVAEGGATSGEIWDPGEDEWFFWAISQSGTTLTLYLAAEDSVAWDATWSTSSAPNFTPNRICYGGANNTVEPSLSICCLMGLWNEGKTVTFLLGQKSLQDAGDTGSSLLAFHVMDGADLSADLTADRGGTNANLTTAGTGTVYSADYPSFGETITGTFTIEVLAVDSATLVLADTSIETGATVQATVTVIDEGGSPFEGISVALSSGDTDVATVESSPLTTNASGVATFTVNGIAAGEAVLTANADSGVATDEETLTVEDVPPVDPPSFYALSPGFSPRTVMGSGIVGATVSLYVDDEIEDTEVVDQFGQWAIAVLRDPDTYALTATQTVDGRTSAAAGPVSMIVIAEPVPSDSSGRSGQRMLRSGKVRRLPPPPVTAGDVQGVISLPTIDAPFRTPKAWPGEDGGQ